MSTLKKINQILRNDDAEELKRIWSTLPRIARRKEIFAQAVRCGGCKQIITYCAPFADNKIKSQMLMSVAEKNQSDMCALIAPFCKASDIQKTLLQSLIKNQMQAFLALHPYSTIEIPATIVGDIINDLNTNYRTNSNQETCLEVFSLLIQAVPQNVLEEALRLKIQMLSILLIPHAGCLAMQENLQAFYCKQTLQKAIEEPRAVELSVLTKRKM